MVLFYLQTPSGFEVQYGWGGRTVDTSIREVQHHTKGSIWGHRPLVVPRVVAAVGSTPLFHCPVPCEEMRLKE